MFCTAHMPPRPALRTAEAPRQEDTRLRAPKAPRHKPGQVYTDWASI